MLNPQTQSSRMEMQRGMTLIEVMIAMVISLLVIGAMVAVMANTLGAGSYTIETTRLQQEMRTAMQLITRDLRRANFHADATDCYAMVDCNPDDSKIKIVEADGNCVQYFFDLDADNDYDAGAFQLITRNSVNIVQVSQDNDDNCGDDWGVENDVTDPEIVNVTALTIGDESYTEVISAAADTHQIGKIRLTMTAQLRNTRRGIPVTKTIEDLIYVRNNVLCPGGVCPDGT